MTSKKRLIRDQHLIRRWLHQQLVACTDPQTRKIISEVRDGYEMAIIVKLEFGSITQMRKMQAQYKMLLSLRLEEKDVPLFLQRCL